MPNAGLPELGPNGAEYPLQPDELADYCASFITDYGLQLVGGCCGTTNEHIRAARRGSAGTSRPPARDPQPEPGVASLYQAVPFRQDAGLLMIGERTNANGSKAFREAMLAERLRATASRSPRPDPRRRALLDLCIDYVGRDGVARHDASSPTDVVDRLDAADRARLHRAAGDRGRPGAARRPLRDQLGQLRGRRRPGLAVPARSCGSPASTAPRSSALTHRRGGPGPHRGEEGARSPTGSSRTSPTNWGMQRRATSSSTA